MVLFFAYFTTVILRKKKCHDIPFFYFAKIQNFRTVVPQNTKFYWTDV
nr:MAG TPA: hypothetical protein [Bacteriophage sp.]